MNHHHTSFVPVVDLMSRRNAILPERSEIVKQMARSLVAGVLGGGCLNLGEDTDVIQTIRCALPQYRSRVILDHLDDALEECKQTLIAAAMSEG